jgi:hypothetical protein
MEVALPDQLAHSRSSDDVVKNAPKRIHTAASQLQDIGENGSFDVKLFSDIWERWMKWTAENDGVKESMIAWEWARAANVASSPVGQTAFNKRHSVSFVVVCGRHVFFTFLRICLISKPLIIGHDPRSLTQK